MHGDISRVNYYVKGKIYYKTVAKAQGQVEGLTRYFTWRNQAIDQ